MNPTASLQPRASTPQPKDPEPYPTPLDNYRGYMEEAANNLNLEQIKRGMWSDSRLVSHKHATHQHQLAHQINIEHQKENNYIDQHARKQEMETQKTHHKDYIETIKKKGQNDKTNREKSLSELKARLQQQLDNDNDSPPSSSEGRKYRDDIPPPLLPKESGKKRWWQRCS